MNPNPIISPTTKTAIVLFNLGGPDHPESVQPFLFNLFNDKAIIGLPNPFRWLLAQFISKRRAPKAQAIYHQIGGKSPILENTQAQAKALETELLKSGKVKTFIAMRYWHPLTEETVAQVKSYAPDNVILLPLYPQFSTTTTGSSLKRWHEEAHNQGLNVKTHAVCCYPTQEKFIDAHAQLLSKYLEEAKPQNTRRVLFSAHGLPEKVIQKGDPYQWQVEEATRRVVEKLKLTDYVNCYQSRVGPMQWIGPSTEDELLRAAKDGVSVVLVPIAFVSEHSETLVELDIEYAELAHRAGLKDYIRVPTLSITPPFIEALAEICLNLTPQPCPMSHTGGRSCPKHLRQCPASV